MQHIMKIQNLQVIHSRDTLLDIPKLDMYRGCSIALVGSNGAGKTTLLESILGLRKTTRGDIALHCDKRDMGVQLQNATYNPEILVKEVFKLHATLYGKTNPKLHESFILKELESKKYGRLSRGQKQRVDLYVALAHQPSTLILDEPGTGLDKRFYEQFITVMRSYQNNPDATVLMASHTGSEVAEASHILWIEGGKIVDFSDKNIMLNKHLGEFKAHIRYSSSLKIDDLLSELSTVSVLRHVRHPCDNEVVIYGDESLRQPMLNMASKHNFSTFALSETDEEDFLELVSTNGFNH